jgi:uncharacterized membrane protein
MAINYRLAYIAIMTVITIALGWGIRDIKIGTVRSHVQGPS